MINRIYEDENHTEYDQATPASGGWHTRFDGGSYYDSRISALPCHLVAMHVEGLIYINGAGGGDLGMECDSIDEEILPSCYALVVIRTGEEKDWANRVTQPAEDKYFYLYSRFSFTSRVAHDGVYDLKDAFETVRECHSVNSNPEMEWEQHRTWHLMPKGFVPSHVRQMLHRTVNTVRETVDNNFGQGKKFFKLPHSK